MKLKYQAPAIEVLRVEDTSVCAGANWVGGVPFERNCGGLVIKGVVKSVGAPSVCTHDDIIVS